MGSVSHSGQIDAPTLKKQKNTDGWVFDWHVVEPDRETREMHQADSPRKNTICIAVSRMMW
jgi:hypothetical protein